MTLVLTINGPDTIWMVADRRISYANRPPKEDARKFISLDTTDGRALIGYAGLGETAGGTEPADWMNAVFRGRSGTVEQSLEGLAAAMGRQLPVHLASLPKNFGATHDVIATAFVNDEARLYTINIFPTQNPKHFNVNLRRHIANGPHSTKLRTPRFAVAGSGSSVIARDKASLRSVLKLVRECDALRVSPEVVADQLAAINQLVHLNAPRSSVGHKCIVIWRHRSSGPRQGGGGHQAYNGTQREDMTEPVPTISNGMDVLAIVRATLPLVLAEHHAFETTGISPGLDGNAMNAAVAKLPTKPDERLK
jgi:hypothetical protein